MPSLFSRIVSGEIPAWKVAETSEFLAFHDVFPLVKGHILVIPKKETDYIFEIESQEYAAFFLFAKKVAIAIKNVIHCKKVGIAVIGLEVPHAHIHLVPMNEMDDINFSRPKIILADEEMSLICKAISEEFNKM
jgi:histidine triad (HIT) family protein